MKDLFPFLCVCYNFIKMRASKSLASAGESGERGVDRRRCFHVPLHLSHLLSNAHFHLKTKGNWAPGGCPWAMVNTEFQAHFMVWFFFHRGIISGQNQVTQSWQPVFSLSLGERKNGVKRKLRFLTGKMEEENAIPPTCQDSASLTNVRVERPPCYPWEVGNHSLRFTEERLCSLSRGCPVWGGGEVPLHFCRGGRWEAQPALQGGQGETGSLSLT